MLGILKAGRCVWLSLGLDSNSASDLMAVKTSSSFPNLMEFIRFLNFRSWSEYPFLIVQIVKLNL